MKENLVLFRTLVSQYIQAKDNNKPHWMPQTFDDQATLTMAVKTSAIDFPAQTEGCSAISQLLVKDFNQNYENVYTLCLNDTITLQDNKLSCLWLVGMTDKQTGNIKVGCGRYDWEFSASQQPTTEVLRVTRLHIGLEQMEILPQIYSEDIFSWLSNSPYPWVSTTTILQDIPDLPELQPVQSYIQE